MNRVKENNGENYFKEKERNNGKSKWNGNNGHKKISN